MEVLPFSNSHASITVAFFLTTNNVFYTPSITTHYAFHTSKPFVARTSRRLRAMPTSRHVSS